MSFHFTYEGNEYLVDTEVVHTVHENSLLMCMVFSLLYGYMCITCVPGAYRSQMKASDLLELGLQMVVNCHVAGN